MMACTDRHFRYLMRLISRHVHLYTEMVTSQALLHGDRRLLRFHPAEHPLALQVGGDDPRDLARCARLARDGGYDEINLNVGCPSERVQAGRFGACLMLEPARVADCVSAMVAAADLPVTVKCRTGVDEHDGEEQLHAFVAMSAAAGCETFIVHARKAWLKGLSPRENRTVPPLHYDRVERLKRAFPHLSIVINGGFHDPAGAAAALATVDGVMIGRAAYDDPYLFSTADRLIYADPHRVASREAVVDDMLSYIEAECGAGTPLHAITRHMLTLFHGVPGARAWRRHLSTRAVRPGAGAEVVTGALALVGAAPAAAV